MVHQNAENKPNGLDFSTLVPEFFSIVNEQEKAGYNYVYRVSKQFLSKSPLIYRFLPRFKSETLLISLFDRISSASDRFCSISLIAFGSFFILLLILVMKMPKFSLQGIPYVFRAVIKGGIQILICLLSDQSNHSST